MDLYLITLVVIVMDAICIFMLGETSCPWTLPSDRFLWVWIAGTTGLSAVLGILLACIALNMGA